MRQILNNIDQESIDVYCWLKNDFKKKGCNNSLFQFVFRSFYKIDNAGLSLEQKKLYFKLLENREENLKKILIELSEIETLNERKTVQFSFATKLLHTLNNDRPIFDSQVGLAVNKHVNGNNLEKRINSCLELYDFLQEFYQKMLANKKIATSIKTFKKKFSAEEISDAKALDFLLWSLGKLKEKN